MANAIHQTHVVVPAYWKPPQFRRPFSRQKQKHQNNTGYATTIVARIYTPYNHFQANNLLDLAVPMSVRVIPIELPGLPFTCEI